MAENLTTVRMSQLTESAPLSDSKFLTLENNSGSLRNAVVKYSDLSNNIIASARSEINAAKNAAVEDAKTYTNSQYSQVDGRVTQVNSRIDTIVVNAASYPTLTGVYQAAETRAGQLDAVLKTDIKTELTNELTDVINTISNVILTDYVADVDSKIDTICANISTDVILLKTEFSDVSTTVNNVSNNVSTVSLLKTAFDSVDNSLTTIANTVADSTLLGMIKLGYVDNPAGGLYGVLLNLNNQAYVYVPGGSGGGGSLPTEWTAVRNYVVNLLSTKFGDNCEKYQAVIDSVLGTSLILSSSYQYFNDTHMDEAEYHVVVLDYKYSGKESNIYYVTTNTAITAEEDIEYFNIDTEHYSYKYLTLLAGSNVHLALSIDLDTLKYIAVNGETIDISSLAKYDVIVVSEDDNDKIYVVKAAAQNYAEEAEVSYAFRLILSRKYDDRYVAYVDTNYSLAKALLEVFAINDNIQETTTKLVNNILKEVTGEIRDKILASLIKSFDFENEINITILANSTKNIVLPISSVIEVVDGTEILTYTPTSLLNINVLNNDIYIMMATMFNSKVHLTLQNTTDSDITLSEGDIEYVMQYTLNTAV